MQLLADAASVLLLLLQGKTYQDALNATDLTIDIAPQRLIQSADALTGGYGIVSHFQLVCMCCSGGAHRQVGISIKTLRLLL